MKLSEAIRHGSTLRPASYQDRFAEVEGRGLCSDVWGAAVEAVWPKVALLNWNPADPVKYEDAMERFRAAQDHYFRGYRQLPVRCPGAHRSVLLASGRETRRGEVKVDTDNQKLQPVGGVTSECAKVVHLYGMVDHLFYAHNNSREEIGEMFAWYEETRDTAELVRAFQHYQAPAVAQRIRNSLLAQARFNAAERAKRGRLALR